MNFLFETPIPIILIFLALLTLTTPAVSKYKWSKICKYIIIIFIVFYLMQVSSMMARKAEVGNRKYKAHLVTIFIININKLIDSGQNDRAKILLTKFSEEYSAVTGYNELEEKFLNDLINESAANKSQERTE